jgi:hypothetical protein
VEQTGSMRPAGSAQVTLPNAHEEYDLGRTTPDFAGVADGEAIDV